MSTPLDRIEAAEKAAHAPNHGEETYELKQAWDRYNEADSLLDKLLRNHAAELIALARAAQNYVRPDVWIEGEPLHGPSIMPELANASTQAETLRDALALLTEDSE